MSDKNSPVHIPLASFSTRAGAAPSLPRCFALVPCAGVGARAGVAGPKQYERLGERSVVGHTLSALERVTRFEAVVVVVAPDDSLFEQAVPDFRGQVCRKGGATRALSVLAGLQALLELGALEHDWVAVHDAARCMLQAAWVDELLDECWDDAVGGLLALPVADTLKREAQGRAVETLDRQHTWVAQTPQMFRLGVLRQALEQGLAHPQSASQITDEASAIERLGLRPKLVLGDWENFKLTWPEDFDRARRLMAGRELARREAGA